MQTRRWISTSQPETLRTVTILLYLNAAFDLFGFLGGGVSLLELALGLAGAAGAYGIANDKKWGYYAAVAAAGLLLAHTLLLLLFNGFGLLGNLNFIINTMFRVALFVLLVHPMSRSYTRIWFK